MTITSAVTAEEYQTLVDCKYRGTAGWALIDDHGGVRAWHAVVTGDPRWNDRHQAMSAFIPDGKRRHWQTLRGWVAVADPNGYLLNEYLTALRSGTYEAVRERRPR